MAIEMIQASLILVMKGTQYGEEFSTPKGRFQN